MVILAAVSIRAAYNSGIIDYGVNGTQKYTEEQKKEESTLKNIEDTMKSAIGRLDNLQGGDDELPSTPGTKPYLPGDDFEPVLDTDLTTGLVIEDGNGNQYVWIEVPNDGTGPNYSSVTGADDAEHILAALIAYASDYRETGYSDTYYEGCGISSQSAYEELYAEMLSSVYTNGGFWIGRYETGISQEESPRTASGNTTQTAVIQKDAYPYNFVTCSQAQNLASNINSGDRTSSLMFGIQWDLILRYLEAKGTDQQYLTFTGTPENPGPGSTSFGNYGDAEFEITSQSAQYADGGPYGELGTWNPVFYSEYGWLFQTKPNGDDFLLTAGANETRNSKMNIVDLAGNVEEWTLEYTGDSFNPCAVRGSVYTYSGCYGPASCRDKYPTSGRYASIPYFGFRVSLY